MLDEAGRESRMNRRSFLKTAGGTAVLLWMAPVGCEDGGETSVQCDDLSVFSSIVSSHNHQLCVPLEDLSNPPASGGMYSSSNVLAGDGGAEYEEGGGASHTHGVFLSADELTRIATGEMVTVQSALADGHMHTFTITA